MAVVIAVVVLVGGGGGGGGGGDGGGSMHFKSRFSNLTDVHKYEMTQAGSSGYCKISS